MEETKKDYSKKILTIPNALSLFRLLLIPVIIWLYRVREDYVWTVIVLVLSGVTDIADGIIARHFGMISDFGKAFDPVADKLTQMAVLYCLIARFPHMVIPLVMLAIKEVFAGITGLIVIHKAKVVPGADWHGKATTASLYTMMAIHIIWYNISGTFSDILIGVCVGVMLMSFIFYGIRNIKMITKAKQEAKATK